MSSTALVMMLSTWTVIACVTGYLFYRVLTIPQKKDS